MAEACKKGYRNRAIGYIMSRFDVLGGFGPMTDHHTLIQAQEADQHKKWIFHYNPYHPPHNCDHCRKIMSLNMV